ncbi:hypothetical protein DFH27DRAFT_524232 [Peziza echinospora]|nr:hypothetical protein DFH27DRAFT_524232 [Peziza echinospora]
MLISQEISEIQTLLLELKGWEAEISPRKGRNKDFLAAIVHRKEGFRCLRLAKKAAIAMKEYMAQMNLNAGDDTEMEKHTASFNMERGKAKKFIRKATIAANECNKAWDLAIAQWMEDKAAKDEADVDGGVEQKGASLGAAIEWDRSLPPSKLRISFYNNLESSREASLSPTFQGPLAAYTSYHKPLKYELLARELPSNLPLKPVLRAQQYLIMLISERIAQLQRALLDIKCKEADVPDERMTNEAFLTVVRLRKEAFRFLKNSKWAEIAMRRHLLEINENAEDGEKLQTSTAQFNEERMKARMNLSEGTMALRECERSWRLAIRQWKKQDKAEKNTAAGKKAKAGSKEHAGGDEPEKKGSSH